MELRQGALEIVDMNFWDGKQVVITGHTGFKGAWLALWLAKKGARVTGVALEPETSPSLFDQLGLHSEIDHRILDIRDGAAMRGLMSEVAPDAVFHLAAQALVRRGYREPVETWATNVMGTINVMEGLRPLKKPCAVVLATTDKVYENQGWAFGYRETDRLGGHDPYSASKAGAEIAIDCWRRSFLDACGPVRIAAARAGNVIGGGDWSEDRIVPDIARALSHNEPVRLRNPSATRPWQHVLEPLGGYMLLAERMADEANGARFATAYNFGPESEAERSVKDLVETALMQWPGSWEDVSSADQPHEASRLALSIDRARAELGWMPRWDFSRSVEETIGWYRAGLNASRQEIRALTLRNIESYEVSLSGGAS